jgi:hypothetical protein
MTRLRGNDTRVLLRLFAVPSLYQRIPKQIFSKPPEPDFFRIRNHKISHPLHALNILQFRLVNDSWRKEEAPAGE